MSDENRQKLTHMQSTLQDFQEQIRDMAMDQGPELMEPLREAAISLVSASEMVGLAKRAS